MNVATGRTNDRVVEIKEDGCISHGLDYTFGLGFEKVSFEEVKEAFLKISCVIAVKSMLCTFIKSAIDFFA